ncbi:MAG TPA: hypothetical protein VMS93_08625 [Candidatus Saccharimonadales bacterium]|nr:hypothetical protein [Candidatus Saccharimonadales bacterium]
MADPKGVSKVARARREKVPPLPKPKPSLEFHRKNLYLMALAALSVVLGYVLLGARSLDLAALFLVAGYLVLFPVAIMVK